MNFDEVKFEERCPTISYSIFLDSDEPNQFRKVMLIKLSGQYRDGAKGNPDSEYMYGIILTASRVWHPRAVVIDISDLEYQWGDEFERIYSVIGVQLWAIVVSDKCRRAMSTLEFGINTKKDITELENFFDNMQDALEYINLKT